MSRPLKVKTMREARAYMRKLKGKEPLVWYNEERLEKIEKKLKEHETRLNNTTKRLLELELNK